MTANFVDAADVDCTRPDVQEAISQWVAGEFSTESPDELKAAPLGYEKMPHFRTTEASGMQADIYLGHNVIYSANKGLEGKTVWWSIGPLPAEILPNP